MSGVWTHTVVDQSPARLLPPEADISEYAYVPVDEPLARTCLVWAHHLTAAPGPEVDEAAFVLDLAIEHCREFRRELVLRFCAEARWPIGADPRKLARRGYLGRQPWIAEE